MGVVTSSLEKSKDEGSNTPLDLEEGIDMQEGRRWNLNLCKAYTSPPPSEMGAKK